MATPLNKADWEPVLIGQESTEGTPVAVSRKLFCTEVEQVGDITRIETNGTTGDRRMHENEQRQGQKDFRLNLVLPFQFSTAMEWILEGFKGATPTGADPKTYPYSSTLPSYTIELTKGSRVKTYTGAKINSLTIAGSGNEPLETRVEFMCHDLSTGGSQTSVAGLSPIIGVYNDCEVNIPYSSTTQDANSIEVVYSNNLTRAIGTDQTPYHLRPGAITCTAKITQLDSSDHGTILAKYLAHTKDSFKLTVTFDSKTATFEMRSGRHIANLPGFTDPDPGDGETEMGIHYNGSDDLMIVTMTDV